jgi:hypothetical protein
MKNIICLLKWLSLNGNGWRMNFIRFGKLRAQSKIMLDNEFIQEVLHGKKYEAGLSVLFAEPYKNGYMMRGPSRHRAQYGLPYDYLGDMVSRLWMPSIARGDIYLVSGDLIEIPQTYFDPHIEEYYDTGQMTYEVGSDGEPVIENASIVKQLSPEEVYFPSGKSIEELFGQKINDASWDVVEYYLEMSMHNEELRQLFENGEIAPELLYEYEDKFGKKGLAEYLDQLSDYWDAGNKIPVDKFLQSK